MILCFLFFAVFISIHFSCSEAGLGDFQANKGYDYKLFDLLDEYPSLYDLVNHLDQDTVNYHLSNVINNRKNEYIENIKDTNRLIGHDQRPLQKTLQEVREILERIINQDVLDYSSAMPETNYAGELYGFIDTLRALDLGIGSDLLSVIRKTGQYELDNYDALTVRNLLIDNIALMRDNDLAEELDANFEMLGKLFLQADYPIWLNGGVNGTLITNRENINPAVHFNTGLGDAVDGINALIMALSSIARDENVRNDLYDLIREVGNVFSLKLETKDGEKAPKDILKQLIETAEDFFTVGGARHGDTSVGLPLYNGDPNNADYYSNSELTKLLLSMQIGNIGLLARADRPESLISMVNPFKSTSSPDYVNSSHKHYLLDKFIQNLAYIDFDPEEAHIEESLYDLIRFDTYGRDRKTSEAYATSYLEQFLFLSAASQAGGWNDGGQNGEVTDGNDPNREHGHGMSIEHVTFNDSLFAMGGGRVMRLQYL